MVSDWTTTTLGQIADSNGYGLVDGPFGSNLRASSYVSSGIPVIRGSNLSLGTGRFRSEDFVYVTDETAMRLERSLCFPNDIVFTKKGTLGQTGLVPDDGQHEKYLLSSNQMKLTVDLSIADPLFVYYFVSSPYSIAKILRDSEATGVPKTNVAYLKEFPIQLPSLAEQKAIAHVLGALDDKIELNRQMNATLEAMAQALFKSWFVDFDPVIDNALVAGNPIPAPFAQRAATRRNALANGTANRATAVPFPAAFHHTDTLGHIPQGWASGRMSDHATITMGQSPKGNTYNNDGLGTPLVNGPVEFGPYFTKKSKWTTSPTKLSEAGDLIVCVRGSTTGRHVKSDGVYCLGRGVCSVRAKQSQGFVDQLFKSNIQTMLGLTTGSTFPNWSRQTISDFEVVRLPQSIIRKFDEIISTNSSRIEKGVKESETLAGLRDVLLPKLISGELRIGDAEKLAAEAGA